MKDRRQRSFDSWPMKEKQLGTQGQLQQESPAREYLEQVKCCHDTDCNESMMKKGFTALKNGTWEENAHPVLDEKGKEANDLSFRVERIFFFPSNLFQVNSVKMRGGLDHLSSVFGHSRKVGFPDFGCLQVGRES